MLPEFDVFYTRLAEQIKIERIKKKVSQQNLADFLGLSRTSIMNIETGRHKPSVYQILQIAMYLNIDYTLLIPYKFKKANNLSTIESIKLKEGITDIGKVEELDKSAQNAVTNFLSDLK
ncbi:MAG: helix-turn-helix transcriptional regulator [Bacteroidetes bacterium]|nr:helix-turn-helix transcriptional regulator [Bacteroidota bacterium]